MDIFPGGHQENIDVKRVDSKPHIFTIIDPTCAIVSVHVCDP